MMALLIQKEFARNHNNRFNIVYSIKVKKNVFNANGDSMLNPLEIANKQILKIASLSLKKTIKNVKFATMEF